jgi:hypothetical protein
VIATDPLGVVRRGRAERVPRAHRRRLRRPVGVERRVRAVGRDELVVAALLDDPALVEDDDPPGLADGRQAVGDDDRGAPGEQPPQARLDAALGVQVDVRRRLVEDEDARVGDERAREGEQLALAGRELRAALADLGLQPVGQGRDEVPGADSAGGGLDLRLVGLRAGRRRCCRRSCR